MAGTSASRKPPSIPMSIFRTTAIGMVLVVVPLAIVGFAFFQGYLIIEQVVLPLLERLPFPDLVGKILSVVSFLVACLAGCYFTGVLVQTRVGSAIRAWFESRLLEKLPGFTIVRGIVLQYLGEEDEVTFRPVLVDLHGTGSRSIGFEVEDFDEESVVVFLPTVPTITLGTVEIVPKDRVEVLPASMHVALESLSQFGSDASKLRLPKP